MNLRRLFNCPSKSQKALIATDVASVMLKCDILATAEYREQREAKDSHDNVCPNCQARKESIVNKIAQVKGSGSVGGTFHLGYGSVSGSMSVDTFEVNHCNKCGNQWKKSKLIYISKTDIVRVSINYLYTILNNPEEKQYRFKTETIKVFDGCYIETILQLAKQNESLIRPKMTNVILSLYFKSIYDTKPRELQTI